MNLNSTLIKKKSDGNNFIRPPPAVKKAVRPPAPKVRGSSVSTPSTSTIWGRNSLINNSTLRSGSTTVSTDAESHIITALTEGRGDARCEVGLATIDLSLPTLILCQIPDGQAYINTLTKINILNPTHIVVPSTFLERESRLIEVIKKQFPQVRVQGVPRKTFNKTYGIDKILQLCLPAVNTIRVGLQHKFYALAAASALLSFLQNNLNVYYSTASINVIYQQSEGYAIIDVGTADRLELVACAKPAQASRYSTLFGVLNYCQTKLGSRLLRSTILQPPSSVDIIEKTTNCVSELIKHPQMLLTIQAMLQRLRNIDQLLTLTTLNGGSNDCSVKHLNYLLTLNSLIDLIAPLKDTIDQCQQPFFHQLKGTLTSDNFSLIAEQIRRMIHPSAQFARGDAGISQRCFAIKSGINGLLDLVRKTYSERLNDMSEYVSLLGDKYKMSLTLANNNTKGYHIVFKLNKQQKRTIKKSDLPAEFVQVYRLAGSFTMKTTELINHSTRLEDIMYEILKISNRMIRDLLEDLKKHLPFFYKLCEDVAHLDMLQSLAESSRRGNYVRPKFGEFTELVKSRHPMLEMLIGEQRVSNPITICKDFNVQIITGPNGSGKSIYMRQVMLLQIMAQIGCYVPADRALFRSMSRMFARVYLEDNMECGASAFVLEMREIKYIMSFLSENSLYIIDEMCRSTAADEGEALATAISEKFCSTSAFVYITTHFTSLAHNISNVHLNVKIWQMETVAIGDTPQDLTLEYKYKLVPGITNLKYYGIYIVKKIWPDYLLEEVYNILDDFKTQPKNKKRIGINDQVRLKYKLEADIRKLKSRGKLTTAAINTRLNEYQHDLLKMGVQIDLDLIRGTRRNKQEGALVHSANASETSSYQNLSNFLREDSENIKKLIPEVRIECHERELCLTEGDSQTSSVRQTINNFNESMCNMAEDEVKSIMEELQHISGTFDDEDFEFSDNSSYQTAKSKVNNSQDDLDQMHLFPLVKVIDGPAWMSDTSCDNIARVNNNGSCGSDSISYSPLRSPPTSKDYHKESIESNIQHTSTSSSIQFLKHNEQRVEISVNTNLVSNSDRRDSGNSKLTSFEKPSAEMSSNSNDNESILSKEKQRKRHLNPIRKFVPPRKLTRKEIQEEFDEQNRKLYEMDMSDSNFSKYYAQIINRPSIRQIQSTEYLAFGRKTEQGAEVITAPPKPLRTRRNLLRKWSSSSNIDMSIFSDINAKRFDEFINSDERDVKSLMFNFNSMDKKITSQTFNFQPHAISDYAAGVESSSNLLNGHSQIGQTYLSSLTPDGYYKEHKQDINQIVNKYLGDANMFESCSLKDDDLQL